MMHVHENIRIYLLNCQSSKVINWNRIEWNRIGFYLIIAKYVLISSHRIVNVNRNRNVMHKESNVRSGRPSLEQRTRTHRHTVTQFDRSNDRGAAVKSEYIIIWNTQTHARTRDTRIINWETTGYEWRHTHTHTHSGFYGYSVSMSMYTWHVRTFA